MPGDDFFDDFEEDVGAADKALFDADDFERFKQLLLNEKGRSLEELQQQFTVLVRVVLEARGIALEDVHQDDPYVEATLNMEAFVQLVKEVAAADATGQQLKDNEEWVPPPPDAEPETDLDYQ